MYTIKGNNCYKKAIPMQTCFSESLEVFCLSSVHFRKHNAATPLLWGFHLLNKNWGGFVLIIDSCGEAEDNNFAYDHSE